MGMGLGVVAAVGVGVSVGLRGRQRRLLETGTFSGWDSHDLAPVLSGPLLRVMADTSRQIN